MKKKKKKRQAMREQTNSWHRHSDLFGGYFKGCSPLLRCGFVINCQVLAECGKDYQGYFSRMGNDGGSDQRSAEASRKRKCAAKPSGWQTSEVALADCLGVACPFGGCVEFRFPA
jgi:hypothetical protein